MPEPVQQKQKKGRLKGTRTHFRILGCILGGMIGDALAARVQSATDAGTLQTDSLGTPLLTGLSSGPLRLSNASLTGLFTLESIVRAYVRACLKGTCDPIATVQHGLLRHAYAQGVAVRAHIAQDNTEWPDGWLVNMPAMKGARSGGTTTLKAMKELFKLGERATNDAADAEAVTRMAPIACWLSPNQAFEFAEASTRSTHEPFTTVRSSACCAKLLSHLLAGCAMYKANCLVGNFIEDDARSKDVFDAFDRAGDYVDSQWDEDMQRELHMRLCARPAGAANDVLPIAVYAAHCWTTFEGAVGFAARAAGVHGAVLTGQLWGAMHGVERIPKVLVEAVEFSDVARTLVNDLIEVKTEELDPEAAWSRYPGW